MRFRWLHRTGHWLNMILAMLIAGSCHACMPSFEIEFDLGFDGRVSLDHDMWLYLAQAYPDEMLVDAPEGQEAILLERALWEAGAASVERVTVNDQRYSWRDIYQDAWVQGDGRLIVDGQTFKVKDIDVLLPWEHAYVKGSVRGLAPAISSALGLRPPGAAEDSPLDNYTASRIYIYSIDGLGVRCFESLRSNVDLELIHMLGDPTIMRLDYPAQGPVNLAGLLTGALPSVHQVLHENEGEIAAETLLDVLEEDGRHALVLAGDPMSPLLTGLGARSVADQDGDGDLTQEIFAEAERLGQEEDPDLMWVGISGLYATASQYGLLAKETLDQASLIDGQLERAMMTVPNGSLVIIMGSHGMHVAGDSVSTGSIMPEDVYVPVWIVQI